MAAEQVEAVQPEGAGVEEVVADKGYLSDETLVALREVGVRSHVSEPERGRRRWQDKKTGETPHWAAPAPPDRHRYAPEPAGAGCSAIFRLIGRLIDRWAGLKRVRESKWTPTALISSFTLASRAQQTDFFHGLIGWRTRELGDRR